MSKIENFVNANIQKDYLNGKFATSTLELIKKYNLEKYIDKSTTIRELLYQHEILENPHRDSISLNFYEFCMYLRDTYYTYLKEVTLELNDISSNVHSYTELSPEDFYKLMLVDINGLFLIRNLIVSNIQYAEYVDRKLDLYEVWYNLVNLPTNATDYKNYYREQLVFSDICYNRFIKGFIYARLPEQIDQRFQQPFSSGFVQYETFEEVLKNNVRTISIIKLSEKTYTNNLAFMLCNCVESSPFTTHKFSNKETLKVLSINDDPTKITREYDLPIYVISGIKLTFTKTNNLYTIRISAHNTFTDGTQKINANSFDQTELNKTDKFTIDYTNDIEIHSSERLNSLVMKIVDNVVTLYLSIGGENYKTNIGYNSVFENFSDIKNTKLCILTNTTISNKQPLIMSSNYTNDLGSSIDTIRVLKQPLTDQQCYNLNRIIL